MKKNYKYVLLVSATTSLIVLAAATVIVTVFSNATCESFGCIGIGVGVLVYSGLCATLAIIAQIIFLKWKNVGNELTFLSVLSVVSVLFVSVKIYTAYQLVITDQRMHDAQSACLEFASEADVDPNLICNYSSAK